MRRFPRAGLRPAVDDNAGSAYGVSNTGSLRPRPANEERDRALLSSLGDIVVVRDAEGILTYCSPSVLDALGYRPEELEGTSDRDLIHASDVGARDDLAASSVPGGPSLPPIELRLHDRGGAWHWFEFVETNRFNDPQLNGIVSYGRDITARHAEHEELLQRSVRDPLTGISTRLALMERLDVALSRGARAQDIVAVLFCDLDDFKLVNDTYGHDFGDQVLVEVARRLEQLQRRSDTVARIGGDEFVIVCDGLHETEQASAIAERVRETVEKPIVVDGRECVISVSIGIATVEGAACEPIDPGALLRNADAAMYRAKRQGRARSLHFDDALLEESAQRFELEAALGPALERGEFVLHYEPIHELARHTVVGVEAFLRWEHPERGFLRPSQFLELAEQTGTIIPIGAWAMRAACLQARHWRDAGWPGWVSLNVSARELAQPGLASTVAATLSETGVEPDRVWLELGEHVLARPNGSATTELTALRELGVHIGVDDFGCGGASLPRLQEMPIDFLKIDGRFVSNLTRGGDVYPAGYDMVAALVQAGTMLGLSVIADGVETELESALLVACGCQFGQGELTQPVPVYATGTPASVGGRQ